MKSKILVATVLLITTVTNSFAYRHHPNFPVIREVIIKTDFQKILINKNFQLVLIQNSGKSSVTIAGDAKDIQDVEVNIINNELRVTSKRNINYSKVVVYVPVKNLSVLNLASGASVSGEGALKFDDLTVVLNRDSKVNLKALGNITLKPAADDCELVFEKNERYKVIYQ